MTMTARSEGRRWSLFLFASALLTAQRSAIVLGQEQDGASHDGHDDEELLHTECPCVFDIPADQEPDCRVYGQLGDGHLIPWYRAGQECLDHFGIDDKIMPFDDLYRMCQFRNQTNVNIDAVLNYIEGHTNQYSQEIIESVAKDTGMFDRDENNSSMLTLADEFVTHDRRSFNCTLSKRLCWAEVKVHFNRNVNKMGPVCASLWGKQVAALRKEQEGTRVLLCEVDGPTPVCGNLSKQVQEEKEKSPGVTCGHYELGPSTTAPPPPTQCGDALAAQQQQDASDAAPPFVMTQTTTTTTATATIVSVVVLLLGFVLV